MTARRRVSLWFRCQQQGRRLSSLAVVLSMDGAAVSLHRWRFLVPVIVGGCQDQQQGRRRSSLVNDGGAVVLSMSAAGARSFAPIPARPPAPRPHRSTKKRTPDAYFAWSVWRSVPRLLQQQSAFISKLEKVIFSKLAISVGAAKSANLPTIVKNRQLFFSFYGVRSRVLTFQSVRF